MDIMELFKSKEEKAYNKLCMQCLSELEKDELKYKLLF